MDRRGRGRGRGRDATGTNPRRRSSRRFANSTRVTKSRRFVFEGRRRRFVSRGRHARRWTRGSPPRSARPCALVVANRGTVVGAGDGDGDGRPHQPRQLRQILLVSDASVTHSRVSCANAPCEEDRPRHDADPSRPRPVAGIRRGSVPRERRRRGRRPRTLRRGDRRLDRDSRGWHATRGGSTVRSMRRHLRAGCGRRRATRRPHGVSRGVPSRAAARDGDGVGGPSRARGRGFHLRRALRRRPEYAHRGRD